MLETVNQLKKERPDLVKLFEGMTHTQLLKQIYKEVLDAVNMEERVQIFMNECTNGMSKTTYTPESIKSMISTKQQSDISEFCQTALEDIEGMDIEEIKSYLQSEIIQ